MTLADPSALSSTAAHALCGAYLVTSMLSMGLEVGAEPKEDKAHRKIQRRLLLRALAINLVLLPLVAVAIVRLMHLSGDLALAILLLSTTTGGRFAPELTRVAGGDLALSVEIALFLAKLTTFTSPPLLKLLVGVEHLELHELVLIAQILLLQLLPYSAGKLLRRRRHSFAERLIPTVRVLEVMSIVAAVAFLVLNRQIRSVLLMGGRGWLALTVLASVSLALGWLLGGGTRRARIAIALSVDVRSLPLALVLAGLAYPHGAIQSMVFGVWLLLLAFSAAFALVARRYGEVVGRPPIERLGFAG